MVFVGRGSGIRNLTTVAVSGTDVSDAFRSFGLASYFCRVLAEDRSFMHSAKTFPAENASKTSYCNELAETGIERCRSKAGPRL